MHDVKTHDAIEVTDVSRADPPARGDGGCRDNAVMRAYIHPSARQFCPDPGVSAGSQQVERQRRKGGQHQLYECLAAHAAVRSRAVHPVQQFCRGYCGDPDVFCVSEYFCQSPEYFVEYCRLAGLANRSLEFYENGGV
jgi:hypothetical protein